MAKKSSLLLRVLTSIFFLNAQKKAVGTAGNSSRLLELLSKALKKATEGNGGLWTALQNRVTLLGRLIKAYVKGEYKVFPWRSLVLVVAVLIYFVSPFDLLPDFLPFLGLTDDAALVVWLFRTLSVDIEDFRRWEEAQALVLKP